MIDDQAVAGVDTCRYTPRAVSQKETSEPTELGSVFGNRATKPAELCGVGCVYLRWTFSSSSVKAIPCGSQGMGGQGTAANLG